MMIRTLTAIAALAASSAAQAAEVRNFVACPIVRDTATVPCWLSEWNGETYYLGIQTDVSAEFHPPSLGHKVLVEGKVANKPRICGGVVLEPVKVSILPELDGSCNTMLPAEDRYQVPFAPRPPGPSGGRLAFGGGPPPAQPKPQPPYQARTFTIDYSFDERKVSGRESRSLSQALAYAGDIKARKIEVIGRRGATKLSDGSVLAEAEDVAEARARQVAGLLREIGVSIPISVRWERTAPNPTGEADYAARRTEISVSP